MKITKLLSIFLFLIFSCSFANAQSWLWARQANLIGQNRFGTESTSSAIDKRNNVYIAGEFQDSMAFNADTLYSIGQCVYLAKYNSNGNFRWALQLKGAMNFGFVATDNANNVYLGGAFYDTLNIGAVQLVTPALYSRDVYLAKFDTNGHVIWARQGYTGLRHDTIIQNEAACTCITTDKANNIYISGWFNDTLVLSKDTIFTKYNAYNIGDNFLAKYDSSGRLIWLRQSQISSAFSYAEATSLSSDLECNAYVTGIVSDTIVFDKDTLKTKWNAESIFLTKYDSSGNVKWVTQSTNDPFTTVAPSSIANDGSENTYMAGYYSDTVMFGAKKLTYIDWGMNFFLAKFDKNGNIAWVQQGNHNHDSLFWGGWSVCTDKRNNVYFDGGLSNGEWGAYNYRISFGYDTLRITTNSQEPSFIVKLDSMGNYECGSIVNGGGDDGSYLVLDSSANHIYFSGEFFENNFILEPDTLHDYFYVNNDFQEIPFVARWQSCAVNALNLSGIVDSVCGNSCNGVAYITPLGGLPPYTYLWSNGQTTQKDTGLCAGTYSVTLTDSLGEKLTIPLTVISVILKPQVSPVKDSICHGDSVQLTGSGGVTYKWSTGSTSNIIWVKPDSTSIYVLHAFKAICADSVSAAIYVRPKITASASIQDSVVCPHDTSYLMVKANNDKVTYHWSNGATSSSIHVNDTVNTTYTVTVHGICDSLTFVKKVTIVPLANPVITGTTYKCEGLIDTLTVSGGNTYLWNNGSTNTKYYTGPVYIDSTITVVAYNSLHCPDTARFIISPKPPPYISIPLSFISCSGNPVILKPNVSGIGPYTYSWSPGGQTTDSITVSDTVTKKYTVILSNGCIDSTSVLVKADNPLLLACCDRTILLGNDTTIVASGNGIVKYQWADTNGVVCLNPICDSIRVTPTVTTTYTLTGTDSSGCTIERVITIIVKETCIKLSIPNVFTPDYPGPYGRNNIFYIKTEAIDTWSLTIYDRWGKEMYHSTNPIQYWDGDTESGGKATGGVYYYIINATCQGGTYKKDGFVQLIR